jgi:hypothetical protein
LALLAACNSSHSGPTIDAGAPAPDGAVTGDGGPVGDDATEPAGAVADVWVRTDTAPFPHADGLSGQTARDAYQGIRRIELLRSADDPDPLVLIDHGDSYVEAGYNDGDETLVGTVPLSRLRSGRYTVGRNVVTHSRYRVDAIMHVGGLVMPGEFDNVQVLSDGTLIDGTVRPQSWFRYVFRSGGMDYPLEGLGAPLPTDPTTGGFRLVLEGGEAAYYYPIDITIDGGIDRDIDVVLQVNMHDAFRWEDQALPGYAGGVFDTTPAASEPVRRFGANRLLVSVEPS